ncbi:hypothetical protein FB45DRAFT_1054271 [Roridomyces roridus]|uniref:F-box domain-containing protein n=1 Tax=Roridomyces roridus TaxID=1738132 RepID=A0AAD7C8M1_9AGAR|nr:hypothetical protein FB45DRAFT_1054271 [Roridomyces roridus]
MPLGPMAFDSKRLGITLLITTLFPAFLLSRALPRPRRSNPCEEVPPEVWAIVAKFCTRQTLARLCSVSSRFYGIFTPILYEEPLAFSFPDWGPGLSVSRGRRLVRTLSTRLASDTQASDSLDPRPVDCVRKFHRMPSDLLGLCDRVSEEACERMLRHLGPGLRALKWDMEFHSALVPRAFNLFPNLMEVSGTDCTEDRTIGLQLLRIPNLEKVYVSLSLEHVWERWGEAWSELGSAFKMLASSSLGLTTLELHLSMDVYSKSDWDDYASPERREYPDWDAYTDLQETVNALRFPALHTLRVWFHIQGARRPHEYAADLSSFLHAHGPTLSHVTLSGNGMLWNPQNISLPALRSFSGSIDHCNVVLGCAAALERVSLWLMRHGVNWSDPGAPFPANAGPCVRSVVVDDSEHRGLPPVVLNTLAAAFPNTTHLDVELDPDMTEYYSVLQMLHSLERIHIRQRAAVPYEHREQSASFLYPTSDFAAHVEKLVPFLPRLSSVEFRLEGTRHAREGSFCSSCGHFSGEGEPKWPPDKTYPPMEVGMDFFVQRCAEGGEVVMRERREVDERARVVGYASALSWKGDEGVDSEEDSEDE